MKRITVLSIIFLVGVVASCGRINVRSDYDGRIDFTTLKTYDWLTIPKEEVKNPANIEHFRNAMNAELKAKGFKMTSESPDFLIRTHGFKKAEKTFIDGFHDKTEWKEGKVVVDFIGPQDNQMIWQGIAEAIVSDSATPDTQRGRIYEGVKKLLKNFPPKS